MSFGIHNGLNSYRYPQNANFRGTSPAAPEIITKPIEKVETVINNTVDSFVKEPKDEEKKKSHKTAITAGSTVLVLSALIALFNPKFSGRFVNKLKNWSHKAGANVQKNKNDFIKGKFYRATERGLKGIADFFQFTNTVNASKDIGFKWLCTAEKFNGVKNEKTRKVLQKCDSGFRKVMSNVHNSITNWFDSISKRTVYGKYKKASKNMDELDSLIYNYRTKLSPAEQKSLDAKLQEIMHSKEYFSKTRTSERLSLQEKAMANLEQDFRNKLFNDYFKKFESPKQAGSLKHNVRHIKDNMSFWAEDMLMPSRNKFEQDGKKAVDTLVGDGKGVKGKYHEAIDILSPHISKEEKTLLETSLQKTGKRLNKANHSECVEYFDKKRDLVLGGAPTDILTGIGMIGLSGIAVGTADTKEDRLSRALTLGFPAVAGIGASMALTAMLFSGVQSMIYGSIASAGLSQIGSAADKVFNPRKPKEVMNA